MPNRQQQDNARWLKEICVWGEVIVWEYEQIYGQQSRKNVASEHAAAISLFATAIATYPAGKAQGILDDLGK